MKRWLVGAIVILSVLVAGVNLWRVDALDYGAGTYGTCTYGECGITISTAATLSLPITPDPATRCTIDKNTVSVTTGASVGYSLTLASTSTAGTLPGDTHGGTINAVSASYASPSALSANTWGYRIDGTGSFGVGPTSAVTNVAIPSLTFAPLASSASPQTIKTTASAAAPDTTDVWYGVCADMSIPADTYSRQVQYTAATN